MVARRVAGGHLHEVLLAVQTGLGGLLKLVVIKRLLPHVLSDAQFVQQFLQAAKAATALKHHNLVEIYDVEHDLARACIIEEYVSGEDLGYLMGATRQVGAPFPVPIACRIIAQAACGLHEGHVKGRQATAALALHGGLHPGKIIVGYEGVTKVADFGLVSSTDPSVSESSQPRLRKLTYRSPEALTHGPVDERADVYSLGVLLHEMLVGAPLFKPSSEAAVGEQAMRLQVPTPSSVNADVSPELDKLVLSALAREPAKRPPSAQHLCRALDSIAAARGATENGSEHGVSAWLKSAFPDRYAERCRLERMTLSQAQEANHKPTDPVPTPRQPHTATNPLAPAPSLTGISTHSAITEASRTVSGYAPGSGSSSPSYPAIQSGAPANEKKRRLWLLLLLGAALVLLLGLAVAVAYWAGTGSRDQAGLARAPRPLAQPPISARPETDLESSPASLVVHVSPEESRLTVDGVVISESAGQDGTILPVPPGKQVQLVVAKAGFDRHVSSVKALPSGVRHVYINLDRSSKPVRPAAVASVGSRAAVEPSSRQAREDRSVRTRRRRAPTRTSRRRSKAAAAATARKSRTDSSRDLSLHVAFSPTDATLAVDGVVRVGRSPVHVRNLKAGVHTVRLVAPGYEARSQRVELVEGVQASSISLALRKQIITAPVSVVSTPAGARLTIDGKTYGKTPVYGVRLEAGKGYDLQLQVGGYRPWNGRLQVRADGDNRIQARLQRVAPVTPPPVEPPRKRQASAPPPVEPPRQGPAPTPPPRRKVEKKFGKVYVMSPNVYGEIWVNNKMRGFPPVVARVPAGPTTVQVRIDGRVQRTKSISIEEGKTARLVFR